MYSSNCPPKIGDNAPDFTLYDTELNKVSLNDLVSRGKPVILAFFPLAFSPVCTKEMCTFRDRLASLEKADAAVVGISVDSPFTLAEFKKKHRIHFPLLSDFNREVITKYCVYHEDLMGLKMVAKRSVFIVLPNKKIAYTWISDDPRVEPDYEEVISTASRLAREK